MIKTLFGLHSPGFIVTDKDEFEETAYLLPFSLIELWSKFQQEPPTYNGMYHFVMYVKVMSNIMNKPDFIEGLKAIKPLLHENSIGFRLPYFYFQISYN